MADDPRRLRVVAKPNVRFHRIEVHCLNEGHLRCVEQPNAKPLRHAELPNAMRLRNGAMSNVKHRRIEARYRSVGLHRVHRLREEQMSSAASLYGLGGRSA